MAIENIVELRGIERTFRGPRGEVPALKGVDLNIAAGEFLTVVGPSGCGKSTLLNIIVGLIEPTRGELLYAGRPYRGINHDIGYVTQADNLFPWRTVLRNVTFGLEMRHLGTRSQRNRRALELLVQVGLKDFAGHYRHELSGGMRQRVNIVRTLAYNPKVILLDEPFGPLDVQNRLQLQDLLLRLWHERPGTTVIFITHDLTEAIGLGDRVVVMSARPGRVREIVTVTLPRPRDIYTIHTNPVFRDLYDRIWAHLAEEMRTAA
ncbi:MAG TPA: ABC transporter ATP-binding protein [Pseudolabrys sp.]|nr:ABC transporter ATP-binding protein [Pseudolabrys sp.]